MSLFGAEHVHHHGLLAGIGAGAMAVLVFGIGLLWMSWHQIAGAVGSAGIVIVYAMMAAVLVAVLSGTVLAFLWLRHRVLHPEVLAGRRAVAAEVLDAAPVTAAIPAPVTLAAAAIEPPRETHMHVHLPPGMPPEAVAAALRAVHPALPPDARTGGPAELGNRGW